MIPFLKSLMKLLTRFIEWSDKKTSEKRLNDVEQARDQLDKAKTPEALRKAARDISKLISNLH